MTNSVQIFTGLLFFAYMYVGIHQVRRLVFDNYQRCAFKGVYIWRAQELRVLVGPLLISHFIRGWLCLINQGVIVTKSWLWRAVSMSHGNQKGGVVQARESVWQWWKLFSSTRSSTFESKITCSGALNLCLSGLIQLLFKGSGHNW